jgi:alkanesulfonate monooxygenase SsuD/methylene tetrahydromethanopterin reductase-like flavin-dependent oxidoreductase (luciferase family)
MLGPSLGFAFNSFTGLRPSQLVTLAAEAERRGFSDLVVTESYNDIMALAAAVAVTTGRARILTAIANAGFRHPALMALGASAVDDLAGGRLVLGLGIGTQWFDRATAAPLLERPIGGLEEYVALVRRVLAAGRSTVEAGDGACRGAYRLDPFRSDFEPGRPAIPIYLAAMGPSMLRLVGRVADGVFLGLTPAESIPEMVSSVRAAAEGAGRDPDAVTIAMQVRTCLNDDLELAREGSRAALPMYFRFPGYARHLRALGYGRVVDQVDAALERGDERAARRAIPDELVDRLAVHGDAVRCREGLERFRAAGVELPIVAIRAAGGAAGGADWEATYRAAIEALAPAATAS